MIVGTFKTFEVGKRHIVAKITDSKYQVYHNVPIFVLREATKQEYLDYQKQEFNILPAEFDILTEGAKFYEISVD